MKRTKLAVVLAAASALVAFAGASVRGEDEKNPALAKAMAEATVSLDEALKTSEREGRPLSAKYEIENGVFQLSVYVVKGNGFNEVIVDHKGGSIKSPSPLRRPTIFSKRKNSSSACQMREFLLIARSATQ
jgi:hypothetical protein